MIDRRDKFDYVDVSSRRLYASFFFFFNDPAPTELSPLPLHDAFPISRLGILHACERNRPRHGRLLALRKALRTGTPRATLVVRESPNRPPHRSARASRTTRVA